VMRWTPDGTALAMCWQHGGFSIWSVFGSLLHHSMAVDTGWDLTEFLFLKLFCTVLETLLTSVQSGIAGIEFSMFLLPASHVFKCIKVTSRSSEKLYD